MGATKASDALRRSAQDPLAFGDFYASHVGPLCVFVARRVYNAEVAMDLTSETFAQAFIARRRFRGSSEGEAAAWLYRIAIRQIGKYFSKGKVERRALHRLGIQAPTLGQDEQERIEQLVSTEALRDAVDAEFALLSAPQRDALRLRVIDGLPYGEVARALAISEPAARNRVMRGLKALSEGLDENPISKEAYP